MHPRLTAVGTFLRKVTAWALMPEDGGPVQAPAPKNLLPPGKSVETLTGYELVGAIQLGYVSIDALSPEQRARYEERQRNHARLIYRSDLGTL